VAREAGIASFSRPTCCRVPSRHLRAQEARHSCRQRVVECSRRRKLHSQLCSVRTLHPESPGHEICPHLRAQRRTRGMQGIKSMALQPDAVLPMTRLVLEVEAEMAAARGDEVRRSLDESNREL
jgi:hypothetical protein